MKTLKQLSTEIHAINREKGFWDEPKTEMQCLLLVQSELFEALEAHRKGSIATCSNEYWESLIASFSVNTKAAADEFALHFKDTIGDELADVVIRLLDFAAAFDIFDIIAENITFEHLRDLSPIGRERFFQWVHNTNGGIFYIIEDENTKKEKENSVIYIITQCFRICPAFGINLEAHITAKIEYNRTRPTKHGKNY